VAALIIPHKRQSSSMSSVRLPTSWKSIVDALRWHADCHGDFPVFSFEDTRGQCETVDFASLEFSARAIAGQLQARGARGPVILLYPPNSSSFVRALFGCFFCGIPALPLMYSHRDHDKSRVCVVAKDAGADFILSTTKESPALQERLAGQLPSITGWLHTDSMDEDFIRRWQAPTLNEKSIAHLQYTSGSTSSPKGVVVTHNNVLHNVQYIDRDFRHDRESIAVSWLPHFHDMGLVYGILSPVVLGFRCVLLRPADFVSDPLHWLRCISRYGATHSGGPNFAFDLSARRLELTDGVDLQLHSWRIAFLGAEMIRASTLDRFAAAASPFGFKPSAYYPAYGLAEATLKVAGNARTKRIYENFSRLQLGQGMAHKVSEGSADRVRLVSCGAAAEDVDAVIVDPNSGERVGPGKVGEVWVSGPGVAAGYWQQQEETQAIFANTFPGDDKRFLRTGDLGFIDDSELFIVGRRKELIIIRGLNHYPGDIESAIEKCHAALGGHLAAAFSIDTEEKEQLILVQEVDRHLTRERQIEILQTISDMIVVNFGVVADDVCLVRKGGLPRTSSGKVQRNKCKSLYEQYMLPVLASSRNLNVEACATSVPVAGLVPHNRKTQLVYSELLDEIRRIAATRAVPIQAGHSLLAAGFDSLELTQLQGAIEHRFNLRIPMQEMLESRTVEELAVYIADILEEPVTESNDERDMGRDEPLRQLETTDNERRLWLLDKIHPGCPAHRIVFGIAIEGSLNLYLFERALVEVGREHPALRSEFVFENGTLRKDYNRETSNTIEVIDCAGAREERARRIEFQAHELCRKPVDLRGDLMRLSLLRFSPQEYCLVVCIHHIVFDALSAEVFVQSISSSYAILAADNGEGVSQNPFDQHSASAKALTWSTSDLEFWKQFLHVAPDTTPLPCEMQST
jgi:acyl-CoA synthetase (AMP-forming)/AMP-acid ligase II/acyl carrier protein